MSVKLRLARAGARKKPFYRVVATESRSPRDGRFIEEVGVYDPRRDPPLIRLDDERVKHWLSSGAVASPTVATLISRVAETK
jgi:small subunit ribosomal protein S16